MTTEAGDRPVILWFRQDLRLADNPALAHAAETGRPIVPVDILDQGFTVRSMGAASLWWLDKSLRALDAALQARGSQLILRRGDSEAELHRLIAETGAGAVFINRLFEPDAFARDADIAHALQAEGIDCKGYNAALMCRPGGVLNGSGDFRHHSGDPAGVEPHGVFAFAQVAADDPFHREKRDALNFAEPGFIHLPRDDRLERGAGNAG